MPNEALVVKVKTYRIGSIRFISDQMRTFAVVFQKKFKLRNPIENFKPPVRSRFAPKVWRSAFLNA